MRGDEKKRLQKQLAGLLGVSLEAYYAKFDNGLTVKCLRNWIEWFGTIRNDE